MKIFRKMKLFPKTFFYMLFLFGIVILIMHVSIYHMLPKFYLGNVNGELEKKLEDLSDNMAAVDLAGAEFLMENCAKRNGINIIADIDGEQKIFQGDSFQITVESNQDQQFEIENMKDVESVIVKNRDVVTRDGVEIHLQASVSTQPAKEAIHLTLLLLPVTSGIAILFSVLFSYLYSRRLTKPMEEMLLVTKRMKDLEQDAYFDVKDEDEIGILAGQINQLYSQLWQTIDSLEKEKRYISEMEKNKVDFLRSASHELKTPLAGLRILLENMQLNVGKYQDHTTYLGEGIETVDQLTAMLQEILDSSRIQGEIGRMEKSLLSVREEIEGVWKDYAVLAKSGGLEMELEISEEAQIEMNRGYFRRAWSNLIGNAVRYTPRNGNIRIIGTKETLSVWNSCTPLSEEQLSHIFEAFYRPDFARDAYSGGNGLGLYIVKEILDANNLPFSFRPEGEGMLFRMGLHPGAELKEEK